MLEDIRNYSLDSEDSVWTVALKGKPGSGKSLFARCLLIEVLKNQKQILSTKNRERQEEYKNKYFPRDLTFEFIVSTCNPEIAKKFVGVWIPILRKVLLMLATFKKVKSTVILNSLL